MIFLRVVCFIEDEQIYLINRDERMHEALIKNFRCTDEHHIFIKMFLPDGL